MDKHKFYAVFVMLGEACNFSCKYCMQHDSIVEQIEAPINLELIDKLNQLSQTSPGNKILLQFYGGEPLIYWNNIKSLSEALDKNKFNLSIISNGSLLTDNKVEFINKYDINYTVSHDGPNTAYTRGKDILLDEQFIDCFLKIKRKGVSQVFSPYSYKVKDVWEYISKYLGDIYINYDPIMDTGSLLKELKDFNWNDVENYFTNLFNEMIDKMNLGQKLDYNETTFVSQFTQRIMSLTDPKYVIGIPRCGVNHRMLNIDLSGNIYLCHNASIKLGTMYDDYSKILNNFNQKYNIYCGSDICLNCEAFPVCGGGCLLVNQPARNEYYCAMYKQLYQVFSNFLLKANYLPE